MSFFPSLASAGQKGTVKSLDAQTSDGIEKAFWKATQGSPFSIVDWFIISAHIAVLDTPKLLTVGFVESTLNHKAKPNDGATGILQIKNPTFITYVAMFGGHEGLRKVLKDFVPKAHKVLCSVFPELPRDKETGVFLDKELGRTMRKEILALRGMGKPKGVLVDALFAAMGIAKHHEELEQVCKGSIPQGGASLHCVHQCQDVSSVEKTITCRSFKPRDKRFGLVAAEIEEHLAKYVSSEPASVLYAQNITSPKPSLT